MGRTKANRPVLIDHKGDLVAHGQPKEPADLDRNRDLTFAGHGRDDLAHRNLRGSGHLAQCKASISLTHCGQRYAPRVEEPLDRAVCPLDRRAVTTPVFVPTRLRIEAAEEAGVLNPDAAALEDAPANDAGSTASSWWSCAFG